MLRGLAGYLGWLLVSEVVGRISFEVVGGILGVVGTKLQVFGYWNCYGVLGGHIYGGC